MEARQEVYDAAKKDVLPIVGDTPIAEGNHMPLWLQRDPQWDYVPYAGGTIGDSGCGLTCAAMAIKYMTLQEVTPLTLASYVGDTCLTDGWLAFAGVTGDLGEEDYGGHVVLIWRADDDGYWVRDPASAANSARAFTLEELERVDFRYFYCIRGGFYGA